MEVKSQSIKLIDPKTLNPFPDNPNKHDEKQIQRLCKLIREFGWRVPIIVSRLSNTVVSGNGRLQAALKMELTHVPVIYQEFANQDEEYAFVVSDNAISEWSQLDKSLINSKLEQLGPIDLDMLGMKKFTLEPIELLDAAEDKKKEPKVCPHCGGEL